MHMVSGKQNIMFQSKGVSRWNFSESWNLADVLTFLKESLGECVIISDFSFAAGLLAGCALEGL